MVTSSASSRWSTVYTLQTLYKQPKAAIRDALLPLIELPGIVLPGKRRLRETFDFYVNLNLPFADIYHMVLMKYLHQKEIVSFGREFDRFQRAAGNRIPGISRIEPW